MSDDSKQKTLSAAHLSEKVQEGDDGVHPHAGFVPETQPRDLLNHLATTFDERVHAAADVRETTLYQDIAKNARSNALTEAVQEGNVSQMQYNLGRVDYSEDASDAGFTTWRRRQLVSEAAVFFLTGGMGTGKTDFGFDSADEWHMVTRGRIATNVESAVERNAHVEGCYDYEQAERLMSESSDDFMLVIDETGQGLTGIGTDQQKARAIAKLLKLVRKGDAPAGTKRCIVFIGQTVRDLSKDLRRLVAQTGAFLHKPDKKVLEVYGDELIEREIPNARPVKTVKGIHKSRITFDTTEEPKFDMSGALEDGEEAESADDARTAEKKRTAQRLRDDGMSGTDIADVVGMSKTWVYEHTEAPAESDDE